MLADTNVKRILNGLHKQLILLEKYFIHYIALKYQIFLRVKVKKSYHLFTSMVQHEWMNQ